jgi:hypothetical protein
MVSFSARTGAATISFAAAGEEVAAVTTTYDPSSKSMAITKLHKRGFSAANYWVEKRSLAEAGIPELDRDRDGMPALDLLTALAAKAAEAPYGGLQRISRAPASDLDRFVIGGLYAEWSRDHSEASEIPAQIRAEWMRHLEDVGSVAFLTRLAELMGSRVIAGDFEIPQIDGGNTKFMDMEPLSVLDLIGIPNLLAPRYWGAESPSQIAPSLPIPKFALHLFLEPALL